MHLQDMGCRTRLSLCLCLALLLPLAAALDFGYHHQQQMEAFLKAVARDHSSITHLHSVGTSVQGRRISPVHVHRPGPAVIHPMHL